MNVRRFLAVAAAAGALTAVPLGGARADSRHDASALVAMRALDARVATIGHRMAVAAADLCAVRQWHYGFALHDLSQYGRNWRGSAIRLFGLDSGPAVLALAAGGPAERAGLREDDVLLAVNGAPLPAAPAGGRASFAHVERLLDALDQAFADGRAELTVRRGGDSRAVAISAEPGCATRFQLIPSPSLNAKADGRYVQLTTGIAQYAADEDELAAVIGHEFAHNILHHRVRLNQAGVRRGVGRMFGRSARLFRQSEEEADRLSVYLIDRAGFDPGAAARFWRRFGPQGIALLGSPTHPDWRSRVAALEEEAERIARARAEGRLPSPPLPASFVAPRNRAAR